MKPSECLTKDDISKEKRHKELMFSFNFYINEIELYLKYNGVTPGEYERIRIATSKENANVSVVPLDHECLSMIADHMVSEGWEDVRVETTYPYRDGTLKKEGFMITEFENNFQCTYLVFRCPERSSS